MPIVVQCSRCQAQMPITDIPASPAICPKCGEVAEFPIVSRGQQSSYADNPVPVPLPYSDAGKERLDTLISYIANAITDEYDASSKYLEMAQLAYDIGQYEIQRQLSSIAGDERRHFGALRTMESNLRGLIK